MDAEEARKATVVSFLRLNYVTFKCVNCFVVSGNMLQRNVHFLFLLLLSS